MTRRLEDWTLADHVRFLGRGAIWWVAAALVAGGATWAMIRGQTETHAEAVLQLGVSPLSAWLEPPNELVARLNGPTFLHDVSRPGAPPVPLSARALAEPGFVRVRGHHEDPARMASTMEAALQKVLADHEARADQAARSLHRRRRQLDADLTRLRGARALTAAPETPQMLEARAGLDRRIASLERERAALLERLGSGWVPRTQLVKPVQYATRTRGRRQVLYRAFGALLCAITLLYLREALRLAPPGPAARP